MINQLSNWALSSHLDRMLLSFSMMTRATMQMKTIAYLVFILESWLCHWTSRV